MAAVEETEVEETVVDEKAKKVDKDKGVNWCKGDYLPLDEQMTNALHKAAKDGDLEAAKALLATPEGKQMMDAQDYCGNTPLHFAARQPIRDHKSRERQEILKLLIAAGANLELGDQFHCTPIHLAAISAHPMGHACEALADAGARLDVQEKNFGNTPLHFGGLVGMDEAMFHMLQFSDGRLRETAKARRASE